MSNAATLPTVGQYVRVTATLGDAGIIEFEEPVHGVVTESENGVVVVRHNRNRWVTGPGYVEAVPSEQNIGRKVRCTSERGGVPSEAVGKVGVITGWYTTGSRPYVWFDPSEVRGYDNGAEWVVADWEYVEDEPTYTPAIGDRVRAFYPNINAPEYHGAIGTIEGINGGEGDHRYAVRFDHNGTRIWMREVEPYTGPVEEAAVEPVEETPALLEVGTRVRVTSGRYEGRTGSIHRVDPPDQTAPYYVIFDDDTRGWVYGTVEQIAGEATPTEPEAEPTAEQRQIADLTRRLQRLEERHHAVNNDWAYLNEQMNEEAERRGWCGDYERLIDAWNRRMTVLQFEPREREIEITVQITGTMTVERTVMVTARDEEAAWDAFNEDPSSYIDADGALTEASRSRSFDDIEFDSV